jgi:hypothetical protein
MPSDADRFTIYRQITRTGLHPVHGNGGPIDRTFQLQAPQLGAAKSAFGPFGAIWRISRDVPLPRLPRKFDVASGTD